MAAALKHADRKRPLHQYLKGLILPGERKSVEPMAARVEPARVRATHQSMHHLVAQANWSDAALLAAVAEAVVPKLSDGGETPVRWIIDDTGIPKKGKHSVGVAHQYCGQTGKRDNCQVAVTLSLATSEASLPVAHRLYLPHAWSEDGERRRKAGVPDEIGFATKPALALAQIEAALEAGLPRGTVLADAAYGDETAWREALTAHGLPYAVGVRAATTVWWGEHQPVPQPSRDAGPGRARRRLKRDATHQPISVAELARALPKQRWRTVTWREGTAQPLRSRFARVRVRAAHQDRPRDEEWLIVEWPPEAADPTHYWLSTLPANDPWQTMIDTVMGRWRIERDYEELKQELGLGHYEGRNWRGFHHHASLCIAAYGFLVLERLSGNKKKPAGLDAPALPEDFRPRGAGADAAPRAHVHCDVSLPVGARHRQNAGTVPMLWV
jgi:SRSO17 transposase